MEHILLHNKPYTMLLLNNMDNNMQHNRHVLPKHKNKRNTNKKHAMILVTTKKEENEILELFHTLTKTGFSRRENLNKFKKGIVKTVLKEGIKVLERDEFEYKINGVLIYHIKK